MRQKTKAATAGDIAKTLLGHKASEETHRQLARLGKKEELELARELAEELKAALGEKRGVSSTRLKSVASDLITVAREGEGVFWVRGDDICILPKSRIPKTGTFDKIPAGSQVHGLRTGIKQTERRAGYSLIFSPTGERFNADSNAVHNVFRGLLERRGFGLSFAWDYRSQQTREATRGAMLAYLQKGEDLLSNLPTIPVEREVLKEVTSNMEAWPQLRREHALRGDPLVESREHGDRLFFRDWTRLHSGAFKDRAAVAEVALCLSVYKATGKPVVGLMATTGNMGASFTRSVWYATHRPDETPIYGSARSPGVKVMLYGTKFNPIKKKAMVEHGARLKEGYRTFNEAFDALKDAMWDNPIEEAIPVWCGDTSIRTEASKVFAYELVLDLVGKNAKNKSRVIEYLRTGDQMHKGRRILNSIVGSITAVMQVGNGINYAGMAKGFREMRALGIIDTMPEIIPVQPERAVDIKVVYGMTASAEDALAIRKLAGMIPDGSVTKADGIDCLFPVAGHEVYAHYGRSSEKVSDREIDRARRMLSEKEGIECEPAAAAGYAALVQEKRLERLLERGRTVVAFITGSKKD